MNKCVLITTALSTAIAFSAFADTDSKDMKELKTTAELRPSDAGFYVAAYGGAQFYTYYGNNRQTLSFPDGSTISSNAAYTPNYGGVGGIKGGYNFESFPICDTMSLRLQPAVEAEALYLGTTSTNGFTGPLGTAATTNDSFNSAAWFINGILRFKNSSIVTPYIGIGVGGEYLTIHGDAVTSFPGEPHVTGLNGSDVDFAAQALGGFDIAIVDHFSIFTEYKFIDAIGTNAGTNAVGFSTYRFKPDQIQQNLIVAGLKYSF